MNEKEQFDLFEKLMLLSLEDPNAIYNIAMRVLIAMSKINEDSQEEFERGLNFMKETYKGLGSKEEMMKAILLKSMMDL